MRIIEETYRFKSALENRGKTEYIILHHRGGSGSPQSIHEGHLKRGFSGIGYHFYLRKDGRIYRGRPVGKTGAHCIGYNSKSVGICFEGNFETEKMPKVQLEAGRELLKYLKAIYPKAEIRRHRDLNSTACPGRNFPFKEITDLTAKKESKEEEFEMIYDYIDENMPEWARETVKKLADRGWIKGDEKGRLGLNDTMLKLLVINDRAGLYN